MPEKPLTIATYAAGASLAAITLVYVFAPTYFIDGDAASSASSRKRGVVGLSNPANDCFINSTMQALAGLGDLRIYLIREVHRRRLDGSAVYLDVVSDSNQPSMPAWKAEGMQRGIVTKGLKDILDALNERPLYKKTISAMSFVKVLEEAFRQRISRQQQDAQEFLQVVAERLCDEYHAGRRARRQAKRNYGVGAVQPLDELTLDRQLSKLAVNGDGSAVDREDQEKQRSLSSTTGNKAQNGGDTHAVQASPKFKFGADSPTDPEALLDDEEEGFPMEGRSESQIECLTCGFKPKASGSTFCTLTLNVPQVNSTSLNACFDGMFKTEYIDDFKCEKCRLVHALETFKSEMLKSNSESFKAAKQKAIESLQLAIETDPEQPPNDVELPDSKYAPKRKIARHVKITNFPKILTLHLSRSIFDAGKSSSKNSAKVSFPERLPLGGLLNQKRYKLLGVVTHKGSHQSGHYESFRRQNVYPPFSTPNAFEKVGVYSKAGTPIVSIAGTPQIGATPRSGDISAMSSTPELLSPALPPSSSRVSLASSLSSPPPRPSSESSRTVGNGRSTPSSQSTPASAPRDSDSNSIRSVAKSARSTLSKVPESFSRSLSKTALSKRSHSTIKGQESFKSPSPSPVPSPRPRKKKVGDRWWRISDDKIKESKTSEVLGMTREVYLLFYELERGEEMDT